MADPTTMNQLQINFHLMSHLAKPIDSQFLYLWILVCSSHQICASLNHSLFYSHQIWASGKCPSPQSTFELSWLAPASHLTKLQFGFLSLHILHKTAAQQTFKINVLYALGLIATDSKSTPICLPRISEINWQKYKQQHSNQDWIAAETTSS